MFVRKESIAMKGLFHFQAKEIEARTLGAKGEYSFTPALTADAFGEVAVHFISVSCFHVDGSLDSVSHSRAFILACASVLQIPSVPVIRSLEPGSLKSCLVRCHHLGAPRDSPSQ